MAFISVPILVHHSVLFDVEEHPGRSFFLHSFKATSAMHVSLPAPHCYLPFFSLVFLLWNSCFTLCPLALVINTRLSGTVLKCQQGLGNLPDRLWIVSAGLEHDMQLANTLFRLFVVFSCCASFLLKLHCREGDQSLNLSCSVALFLKSVCLLTRMEILSISCCESGVVFA